jgi:hypothetical protein
MRNASANLKARIEAIEGERKVERLDFTPRD